MNAYNREIINMETTYYIIIFGSNKDLWKTLKIIFNFLLSSSFNVWSSIILLLHSARELSESWTVSWSEDDVDVSKRHDLRDLLSVIAGRWARLRRPCDAALGGGTAVENAESSGERRQSSFRPAAG